jgi:hypothetical protein
MKLLKIVTIGCFAAVASLFVGSTASASWVVVLTDPCAKLFEGNNFETCKASITPDPHCADHGTCDFNVCKNVAQHDPSVHCGQFSWTCNKGTGLLEHNGAVIRVGDVCRYYGDTGIIEWTSDNCTPEDLHNFDFWCPPEDGNGGKPWGSGGPPDWFLITVKPTT